MRLREQEYFDLQLMQVLSSFVFLDTTGSFRHLFEYLSRHVRMAQRTTAFAAGLVHPLDLGRFAVR